MAIQIQFRRGTEAEWESVNPILAEGEMGIETDTNLFKIGDGVLPWTSLDYGGLRGFSGSTGFTGSIGNVGAIENVLYVSKSGNDANDGSSLNESKLTIKSALSVAQNGDTIFVKSGDYTEDNPLIVPEGVAIVGDNLRTTTIRPENRTQDLFYVDNGVYIAHVTFKDHESPAAAVAFNPDGSAGVIHTSPYVQNCTSMTTTGTGMRVDGSHVTGLRSMVVDAFTQYNQGGIGIHMLNRGNTQLVSVFTICCDIAFLCESGGFCSITNSNSSFGNFALKADGVSSTLYEGKVVGETLGDTFVVDNLISKPNVGDAVKFAGDTTYYTVGEATSLVSGSTEITAPDFSVESSTKKNLRNVVLDEKSKIQIDTVDYLNETYPDFDFVQSKASRDTGLVIDAAVDDMIFGTNYKTVLAAQSYYRQSGDYLIQNQLAQTIASLEFARDEVRSVAGVTTEADTIIDNINIIITALDQGENTIPTVSYPDPTGVSANASNAKTILQANKAFLVEEGIEYIAQNYPSLTYDSAKCREDINFIINAVTYDLLYEGNSQTADAADEYYSGGYLQIPSSQRAVTADTFAYIKSVAKDVVTHTNVAALQTNESQVISGSPATSTEADTVGGLFDIVINLIENAYSSTIILQENVPAAIADNAAVTFHQFSLITSSGHTFEWVGAGTNINTALPYLGGTPSVDAQVTEANQGKVYFTGTDQFGDFRIGNDFVINRNNGTIEGRTFTKSLFAVMTPYILAIGE